MKNVGSINIDLDEITVDHQRYADNHTIIINKNLPGCGSLTMQLRWKENG